MDRMLNSKRPENATVRRTCQWRLNRMTEFGCRILSKKGLRLLLGITGVMGFFANYEGARSRANAETFGLSGR